MFFKVLKINVMKKSLQLFLLLLFSSLNANLFSQTPTILNGNLRFNGAVNTQVVSGSNVYVGGAFTAINAKTGPVLALDPTTLQPIFLPIRRATISMFAQIGGVGEVRTVCPDGSGGFFIGGSFTMINNPSISNLVRVNSAGAIYPITNQFINSTVQKIIVNGNFAYVVGLFGARRIILSTNAQDSWNQQFNSATIYDAKIYNNKLYLGGRFFNGTNYRPLVRYDLASNALLDNTWNPNIWSSSLSSASNNVTIYSMALFNDNLFFGGINLNFVNGSQRQNLAGINLSTNGVHSLTTMFNGQINALAVSGNNLFVGGSFSSCRNNITSSYLTRTNMVLVNLSVGQLNVGWTPNPNSSVHALEVINGNLFVGGAFNVINGQTINRLANYSSSSVTNPIINTNFKPNPNNVVYGIANNISSVVACGSFTEVEYVKKNRIAQINTSTGLPTVFETNIDNGEVNSILVNGTDVFIGGSFTLANGLVRNSFLAVNGSSGLANNSIQINANGPIYSMTMNFASLYLGGDFTSLSTPLNAGQLNRSYLGALSIGTGATLLTGFNANVNAAVFATEYINGYLYIGGSFTTPSNRVAMVNGNNGSVISTFNARVANNLAGQSYVRDIIQIDVSRIAICGSFLGGFTQTNFNKDCGLAIMNNTNGNINYINVVGLTNPYLNNEIVKMEKIGSNSVEYAYRNTSIGLQSMNISTGNISSLLTFTSSGSINSLVYTNSNYSYGGSFSSNLSIPEYKNLGFINFTTSNAPTLTASNFIAGNIQYSSMNLNWISGNGANRIVLARPYSNSFTAPSNMNSYNVGSSIGGATVIYNGTGNSMVYSNLMPNTQYFFRVYEYNGNGFTATYGNTFLAGSATTLACTKPNSPFVGITTNISSPTSMNVSWGANSTGQNLIVVKEGSPVDFIPQDGQSYGVSNVFGAAALGSGNFAIAINGTNTTLTNLTPGATYYFKIWSVGYNGFCGYLYSSGNLSSSNTTPLLAAPPIFASSNMQFQNLSPSITRVSWVSGNGSKRLLLAVEGNYTNVVGAYTANGAIYTANANFSSFSPFPSQITLNGAPVNAKVVYNGNGNTAFVSGLLSNTDYTYVVVEYNEIVGFPNSTAYLGNTVLAGSYKTDPSIQAPSLSASAPNSIETKNTIRLKWTNGNGTQRLVVARQGLPVSWLPSGNVNFPANADFTAGTDLGSGQKVVYNGTAATTDISGLLPYTVYHFAIYEYNSVFNNGTSVIEYAYRTQGPATYNVKTASPSWPRTAGGSETDAAGSVAVDANGNVYVAGTIRGNANFGLTTVTAAGNDIFLAKYNSTGDLLWLRTAGGSGDEAASSVVIDASGNPYVGGSFRGTALFNNYSVTAVGSDDGFIAKYNSAGDPQWVRAFGSDSQDVVNAMAIDAAGNILAAGFHSGNTSFQGSTTTLTTNGKSDLIIAKYNSSGTLAWARSGGSTGYDFAFGIGSDQNNNVFICGEIKGAGTFGTASSTFAGATDAILVKYDASGAPQFANNYGSTSEDRAMSLDVDANGIVYLVGAFSNTVSFGLTNLVSLGITDGFLTKINGSNGTVLWAKQHGGISQDIATSVDIAANGEIIVAGSFGGLANFDSQVLTSSGNLDIYTAIYTSNGLLNVAKRFGGPLDDAARGIYAISPTNTFITGYFNAAASFGGFEVFTKVQPILPAGNWDLFIHNIGAILNNDPSADLVSWHRFNGNANDFSGNNYNGTIVSAGGSNIVTAINDRNNTVGSAYNFTGNGKVDFTIPNNGTLDNLNELTVMAWVKVTGFTGLNYTDRCLISTDAADGMSFQLILTKEQGLFGSIFDASSNPIGGASSFNYVYQNATWAHVALTYENGIQTRVYLNGSVAGTNGAWANSPYNLSGKRYTIGAGGASLSGPFVYSYNMNGGLDDVRIYKKALTSVQITDIMASASNISAPPPMENNVKTYSKFDVSAIWPNPSNGLLNFEMINETEQDVSFTVVDLSGKIVYQVEPLSYDSGVIRKTFDLENLQSGYYTLQVLKGNEVSNHKLILNK